MLDIKRVLNTAGIDPGFTRPCNTLSLPLDHLAYTCFKFFFIPLNSFLSRVELIKMVSTTAGIRLRAIPLFFFVLLFPGL
jgi:hypothetical protein